MDSGRLELDLPEALALYIFFQRHEEELTGRIASFSDRVRGYLYERLSIEEMERPEELLAQIAIGH